jgi:hypothetical protein
MDKTHVEIMWKVTDEISCARVYVMNMNKTTLFKS